jgi:hypothetical protein
MCKERRRYLFYSKTRKLILSFFLIVFVAFGTIGGCHNDDQLQLHHRLHHQLQSLNRETLSLVLCCSACLKEV